MLIIILSIAFIILLAFAFRSLATIDVCFTFRQTNHVKYVEKGGVLDHMIPEVPGYVLVSKKDTKDKVLLFEEALGRKQPISWLNEILHKLLGIYFYGIYPFKKIKRFEIERKVENPDGKNPSNWIQDKGKEIITAFRFKFPRTFVFVDVELGDRLEVNLKLVVKLQLVNPYIPVYEFGTDYFNQIGSILQSQIIDKMKEFLEINDFVKIDKGEVTGFLKKYEYGYQGEGGDTRLNEQLKRQVGVHIIGIAINDWEPSEPQVKKAIEQKAIEKAEGEARIEKATQTRKEKKIGADQFAEVLEIETKAKVSAAVSLNKVRTDYFQETVKNLSVDKVNPNLVVETAGRIIEAEETAKLQNLTTLVKGSAQAVVAVGGNGK